MPARREETMNKYEHGNRSEGVVLCAYLKAGFTVSIPFGAGASYDLIVDCGARLLKVQVKTAWLSGGVVRLSPGFHAHKTSGSWLT